jgi:hypothetical protein
VGYEFPVASYQLRVASCGGWVLGVKCCWLGVVGYEFPVASLYILIKKGATFQLKSIPLIDNR